MKQLYSVMMKVAPLLLLTALLLFFLLLSLFLQPLQLQALLLTLLQRRAAQVFSCVERHLRT